MSGDKLIWVKFTISDKEHKALFYEGAKLRDGSDPRWWRKYLRERLTKGLRIDRP